MHNNSYPLLQGCNFSIYLNNPQINILLYFLLVCVYTADSIKFERWPNSESE